MQKVYRYKQLIKTLELEEVLNNPSAKEYVEIDGIKANTNKLKKDIKKVLSNPNIGKDKYDSNIYKLVHKTFAKLPREVVHDLRFWQYLCLNEFKFFVEKRFDNPKTHFLGSQTLGGSHDNALFRLFRIGELKNIDGDYNLSNIACSSQQRLLDIFDRKIGLRDSSVKALLEKGRGLIDDDFSDLVVDLNEKGGAIFLPSLNSAEIKKII